MRRSARTTSQSPYPSSLLQFIVVDSREQISWKGLFAWRNKGNMAALIPLQMQTPTSCTERGSELCVSSSPNTPSSMYFPKTSILVEPHESRSYIVPVMTYAIKRCTKLEWQNVLENVRRAYWEGQYLQCSNYCISVLECTRGLVSAFLMYQSTSQRHPLHCFRCLIYSILHP